nr:MAG TPA: hypothetical protein [Caudoviricetes sp.]DAQ95620.1 MAG TPA: hypothetical protein [Caudoviricetes sp.]
MPLPKRQLLRNISVQSHCQRLHRLLCMQTLVQPSPPPPQRRRGLAAATPTITPVCCGFTVAVLSWVCQRQKGETAVFSQQN